MFNLDIDINRYFYEISQIPRGSGHEEKISEYLEAFAKSHSLKYVRDHTNNIIIYKDASKGYESHDSIILQGHMDMVWEKGFDSNHDFYNDPLELIESDGMLYANNTTLGADDGVGVCYMLAILSNDALKHPALECVFTVGEETGFDGAFALDYSLLHSKRFIGLDCEGEYEVYISSAGGCSTDLHIPYKTEENKDTCYELTINSLLGGHSGAMIHKGRGNAIKLLNRMMYALLHKGIDCRLIEYTGGNKSNAIPSYATCIFASNATYDDIDEVLTESYNDILDEYHISEPSMQVALSQHKFINICFDATSTERVIRCIYSTINGTLMMSQQIEDLPTKSLNLGVLENNDLEVILHFSLRGVLEASIRDMNDQLLSIAEIYGGYIESSSFYPGWDYDPDSEMRNKYEAFYYQKTGMHLKEVATHGGLEIGLFKQKIENLDVVAMGPQMYDIHTYNEHLDLASYDRMYHILIEFLETL